MRVRVSFDVSVVAGMVAGLLVVLPSFATVAEAQDESPGPPWVETRAPGVFGENSPAAAREWSVAYQVDATIRLPLLIVRIPIVSRANVGVTSFSTRDFTTDQQTGIRAYEFFAASFPERARGLNRLGFLREALLMETGGLAETAQFGVISSEREDTMAKADQVLDHDAEQLPYSIIDSRVTTAAADSRVLRLLLAGQWDSAAGLHADVRPHWDGRDPSYIRHLPNDASDAYGTPLAFLGGLQHSLQQVANAMAAGEDAWRTRREQPYVHNGRLFRFELRKVERDEDRAEELALTGWLEDPAALHRLEYRLRDARGKEIDRFKLWVELRASAPGDRFSAPHLPLAYEYEPGAYLRLRAVRVGNPAAVVDDRR